jgi:AraC family transcriptional regulator, arabinose operon regulatory protein
MSGPSDTWLKAGLLPEFIIIYCVDGCGWLKLAGKRWPIVRGDVFCCPPGLEHSYGADPDDPWTKYYFHFRGQQAASYMALLGLTPDAPVLSIGENTRILSWIHDIFNILRSGYNHGNLLLASALLGNILSYMYYLSLNTALNPSTDMSLEKVITYMLDNINGTLTLDQLSGYAGLSKYHFARLFKTKTGYAPVDYFIRLKIHKACELLEVYTAKISSISASLGFGNPYYFSNTFKRIIGQSPQHYRQMAQFGPARANQPDVSTGSQ